MATGNYALLNTGPVQKTDWRAINDVMAKDYPSSYNRPEPAAPAPMAPRETPQPQQYTQPTPAPAPTPAPTPAPAPPSPAPVAAGPAPSGGGAGNNSALQGLSAAIARGQSGPMPGWADDPALAQTAGELGTRSPGSPIGVLSNVVQRRGRFY